MEGLFGQREDLRKAIKHFENSGTDNRMERIEALFELIHIYGSTGCNARYKSALGEFLSATDAYLKENSGDKYVSKLKEEVVMLIPLNNLHERVQGLSKLAAQCVSTNDLDEFIDVLNQLIEIADCFLNRIPSQYVEKMKGDVVKLKESMLKIMQSSGEKTGQEESASFDQPITSSEQLFAVEGEATSEVGFQFR